MSRVAIISAGFCLGLSTLPAIAQGVPTQDNSAIGRAIARVAALSSCAGVRRPRAKLVAGYSRFRRRSSLPPIARARFRLAARICPCARNAFFSSALCSLMLRARSK